MEFQNEFSLEHRTKEFERIKSKYPNRVPIIVERYENVDRSLPELTKKKFLVPRNITFGQFLYILRTRMELPPEKALFVFVNNVLPLNSEQVNTIYEEHKSEDGFLYCCYSSENTFG